MSPDSRPMPHPDGESAGLARALAAAVAARPALAERLGPLDPVALEALPQTGLNHVHLRLPGGALLFRVPRFSHFRLAPAANLEYQAAAFARAAPSGHTPRLHAVLPPAAGLPMGALLVDAVPGGRLSLPQDLGAMADCLAAVHALALPPAPERPPLADHADPVAGTLRIVEAQAAHLEAVAASREAAARIREELVWARGFAHEAAGRPQPRALVLTDTHPGNFVRRPDGRAIFVDLEKALYGSPAIDLAHASLATSLRWDPGGGWALARGEVAAFYAAYLERVGAAAAALLGPWLLPMRRLTWLRTTTWICAWWAEAGQALAASPQLDEETAARLAHVRARIADYTSAETVAAIRAEWLGPDRLALA